MTKKMMTMLLFLLTLLAGPGCSKSDGGGATLSIPTLVPLVKASLPAGLKPGGTTAVTPTLMIERARQDAEARSFSTTPSNANGQLAAGYLINLFQNTFSSAAGFTQGYLMAQVATIDSRMSLFSGVQVTGCLSNTAQPLAIDLSAIDPVLKLTLKTIQCFAPFSSSSTQSGEAFGQSGTTSSVWVQPSDNFTTTGGFINYANVDNYGSTSASAPEQVDGVSISFNPNTSGTTGGILNIARFLATPSAGTFEMYYAGSQGAIGTTTSNDTSFIGVGFRIISDGTLIYADGTLCTDPSGLACNATPSDWQAFNVCLDASTVTQHATASDCTTLANSFQLNTTATTDPLTFTEITGDANLGDSYGEMSSAPGPTTANANAVLPYGQISVFASVGTKYGP